MEFLRPYFELFRWCRARRREQQGRHPLDGIAEAVLPLVVVAETSVAETVPRAPRRRPGLVETAPRGGDVPVPAPPRPEPIGPHYVVWVVPGHPDMAGIHSGPGAWRAIEAQLPGRRYHYHTGCRLRGHIELPEGRRRRLSYQEAYDMYVGEAERHRVVAEPQFFVWL